MNASTAAKSFQNPPDGSKAGAMDPEVKADLRSSHFNLGGHHNMYMTMNNKNYSYANAS